MSSGPQHTPARNFLRPDDFSPDALMRALDFADGAREGQRLLDGKILGLLFASESLRTVSSLKAAMARGGGSCLGIDSPRGSYIDTARAQTAESIIDTATSLAAFSDCLAVRAEIESDHLRAAPIPIINAGIGDDHCLVATWFLNCIAKRHPTLKKIRVGVYGLARYSPPVKSIYRLLAPFGVEFFEDTTVRAASTEESLRTVVAASGSIIASAPIAEWIAAVDALIVADCMGQFGHDEAIVLQFNNEFRPLDQHMLAPLRPNAFWVYFMPRRLTNGRPTVDSSLDHDRRLCNAELFAESVYCNVGIIAEILRGC